MLHCWLQAGAQIRKLRVRRPGAKFNRLNKFGGTMKKILVSTVVALLLVGALVSMAFASPAQKQLLFKGSWNTVENNQLDLPTILVHGNGGGSVTGLDRYMVH